jgi:hypothetical protein
MRNRIRSLAQICYSNGYPEIARKCLETTADPLDALLHHVVVAGDVRAIGQLHAEPGLVDSTSLTAMAKYLAGQRLAPLPAAPQKPPMATKSSLVTPSTRATAILAGKPVTSMLWVDNPRHWFPETIFEDSSKAKPATISAAPGQKLEQPPSPAPRTLSDASEELLRTSPFPDLPPSLKGPLPKSALDIDEIPCTTLDPE